MASTRGRLRGRPAGQMTANRRRILRELAAASERGERLTLAELARRCGLYDYREARATVRDIKRYGLAGVER